MPVTFSWEINPATLLAICGGALALIKFWLDASAKADAALSAARDAEAKADAAHEKITILQSALSAYRETQAERLVSREVLREVEDRLTTSIERLGDRLDALVERLVIEARKNPP